MPLMTMRMAESELEIELFGTEDSFLNRPVNVKPLFVTLFAYFPVVSNEKLVFYFGKATFLFFFFFLLLGFLNAFTASAPTSEQLLKYAKTTSLLNCVR